MIRPRYWIRHLIARRALQDYPIYDVPHKEAEGEIGEARAKENFDYFMQVRMGRLAHFTDWLRNHFAVKATLDGEGLRAVGRWVENCGSGLIGDEDLLSRMMIYGTYQPAWEGAYAGYNVMIDIGIFQSEYLIVRRPQLRWEIYRGHEIEPATFDSIDFLKPCLGCDGLLQKHSALRVGWSCIANARARSTIGRTDWLPGDLLVSNTKSVLHANKIPYLAGDYRDEPI